MSQDQQYKHSYKYWLEVFDFDEQATKPQHLGRETPARANHLLFS